MDDDFVKELEELTKGLEKEFINDIKSESTLKTTSVKNEQDTQKHATPNASKMDPFDFFKNLDGDGDLMGGIEKLLNMKDFNVNPLDSMDESDPQTKEMIKLLSKISHHNNIDDNLKDLELKLNSFSQSQNLPNQNHPNTKPSAETNFNVYPNSSSEIKIEETNPFVDSFRELNNESLEDGFKNIMNLMGCSPNGTADETGGIENLLKKLSNKTEEKDLPEEEKNKQLYQMFEELLGFLLGSNLLAEPLTQIKNSVSSYLNKNEGKLEKDVEEKYKSMLKYIDTILDEVNKKEPNKALVIEIFYKLHEISDFDNDIVLQCSPEAKHFTDLFNSGLNTKK